VGVATSADNLLEDALSSISGISIDGLIGDEVRIEQAGDNFSEEGDRFLVEFLRVAYVAEGDLIKGVF
jgi:hypothetical protein